MNMRKVLRTYLLVCGSMVMLQPIQGRAQQNPSAPATRGQPAVAERDGQHDFDFCLGAWRTHIRHLEHPLTGSTTWTELNGTVVHKPIWGGRANIDELEVDGPAGHMQELTLYLYNPQSHQWSISGADSSDGNLGRPLIGEFKNGRGEFIDQEQFKGKTILVRGVWSDITADSHRFEQSFSNDGGKTWEPNFIATLTRAKL